MLRKMGSDNEGFLIRNRCCDGSAADVWSPDTDEMVAKKIKISN